jgi:hypothetical protein
MTDDTDPVHDDHEFEGLDDKDSRPWLALIEDAETAFKEYQSKADNLDRLYANLSMLSGDGRDRQFQMFWANIQVLGPSIYSRPPVPVVTPRFKDRKPIPRTASELLERCTVVGFESEDIDGVMRHTRDDLTVLARGAAWVRYESEDDIERVCIDHADRKDFLHDPARVWKEVDWVAKRSWLTEPKMRKRFKKTSGDKYKEAAYDTHKNEQGHDDGRLKAGVWEIWSKSKKKVVWVTEGVDEVLDEDKPHLKLEGFFPCPKPAYSTVQRGSLVPVPDMLFYKDQLEEINELTARIGALCDALQVRGFYPAGAGEIGDAIEAAIKNLSDNKILIPITNWAMVGQGGVKDMIVWLPIDQVATTIMQLVEMRKQLIDDVYQITGLSDIMRGSTVASETLGAQELKSQYGSVRIRDRQNELVRFARDLVRISAEIMAENFSQKSMLDMSQMDIETDAECAEKKRGLEQQIQAIIEQVEQAKTNPELMAQAQQNTEQAQQMLAQAKQQAEGLKAQIAKVEETPTIEKVMKLLRDQRTRPYILDIETDSTVAPDENATKQRATEFITAVGGFMGQAIPLVQAVPQSSKLMAETLKYVAGQFRAGRQLEGTIEEFADEMAKVAGQPKADPEAIKAQSEAQAAQAKQAMDMQAAQADMAERQANAQKTMAEAQNKIADDEQKRKIAFAEAVDAARARSADIDGKAQLVGLELTQKQEKHAQELELGALAIKKLRLEIQGVQVKTASTMATTAASIEQKEVQTDAAERQTDAKLEANEHGMQMNQMKTQAGIEATKAKQTEPA